MTSAAGHGRRAGEDEEWGGARFFKIILQSTIDEKKLLLPRKFIRESAGGLLHSASATLKVPTGDKWEVELIKEGEEDVYFGDHGWQRFAEFYSLLYGHLLVFEYSGRSDFSVVIFGRSATEIDYPVREVIAISDCDSDSASDWASVEVLDDDDDVDAAQVKENNKGKSPMVAGEGNNNSKETRKKRCWKSSGELESKGGGIPSSRKGRAVAMDGIRFRTELPSFQVEKMQKSCWKSSQELEAKGGLNKKVRVEVEEKQGSSDKPSSSRKRRALAVNGITRGRTFFEKEMSRSYFNSGPSIPLDFAEENIGKTEHEVILEFGGKDWPVGLMMQHNKYPKLGYGWLKFRDDIKLRPGDHLKFELINRGVNVKLKVTIMRESK